MSDCQDCQGVVPCVDCNETHLITQTFCSDGCKEFVGSDCVEYSGDDVTVGNINIKKKDRLTKVIQELLKNTYNVSLDLQFNNDTRTISLIKDGQTVASKVIPDLDDQYLKLNGAKLEIWKPSGVPGEVGDVKINEVDLKAILGGNNTQLTSRSINITVDSTNTQSFRLELVPSTDTGNIFSLGSDGKPYVPAIGRGVTDVNITPDDCFTFEKVIGRNGSISFVQTVDWACVADKICGLCNTGNVCTPATNLTVTSA